MALVQTVPFKVQFVSKNVKNCFSCNYTTDVHGGVFFFYLTKYLTYRDIIIVLVEACEHLVDAYEHILKSFCIANIEKICRENLKML